MRVRVVTSTICLTMAGMCAAQNAPQAQKKAGADELPEIMVTAEKRAERLQDVPAAVSALSGETLQDMGAREFTDYARSIPGLTFTDSGAGRQTPAIRRNKPIGGRRDGGLLHR